MEHRKFLQRLDELVSELTHAQAQRLRHCRSAAKVTRCSVFWSSASRMIPNAHTAARAALKAGAARETACRAAASLDCSTHLGFRNPLTGTSLAGAKKERLAGFTRRAQPLPVRKARKA